MKQFFVSNDFKPVYYDGEQGELLCPIAFGAQVHLQEMLNVSLKGVRCRGLTIACETVPASRSQRDLDPNRTRAGG